MAASRRRASNSTIEACRLLRRFISRGACQLVNLRHVLEGEPVNSLSANNLVISLSGFLVGLLVGQTGTGGGSLMTPLLVLLFGVHPATAVGTDLLYASATKSVGTLV